MICLRMENSDINRGLWFNSVGKISNDFKKLLDKDVSMEYMEELVDTSSVVTNLEDLFTWFKFDELKELSKSGYKLHIFESKEVFWCDRYTHFYVQRWDKKMITIIDLSNIKTKEELIDKINKYL